jgi:alginate O-acetyltransferase complex protein AlgI
VVFSSLEFLFFFLPGTLALYYLAPKKLKNSVLLLGSVGFYAYGAGAFVLILAVSVALDYTAGFIAGRGHRLQDRRLTRLAITISVVVNLALLGYFKYANFAVAQLNELGDRLGLGTIAWNSIILPIGISFFTFQSMSYTIDVARGRSNHIRNPVDFALYVILFPQLIAGPIVRFHEISLEIHERRSTVDDFSVGIVRFAHGLVKKVVIADSVALVVEPVFGLPADRLTTGAAWLGIIAYTIQIYFDFSGYSDMAIGLGRMFGFHFPENFRRPYSAVSITDFWRRWHITLSNWFRDYLYVPLGGSRASTAQTYRNLVIVFLLTGLWHGANWTFVVWGIYHGALLVAERLAGRRPTGDEAPNSWVRRSTTLLAVMIGWVVFRANSLSQAGGILTAMFTWTGASLPPEVAISLTTRVQIALLVGIGIVLLPRDLVGGIEIPRAVGRWPAVARAALMLIAFPFAMALTATGTFSPFIYYQF